MEDFSSEDSGADDCLLAVPGFNATRGDLKGLLRILDAASSFRRFKDRSSVAAAIADSSGTSCRI